MACDHHRSSWPRREDSPGVRSSRASWNDWPAFAKRSVTGWQSSPRAGSPLARRPLPRSLQAPTLSSCGRGSSIAGHRSSVRRFGWYDSQLYSQGRGQDAALRFGVAPMSVEVTAAMTAAPKLDAPRIITPLPGPRAKALIARDEAVVSPSLTRAYPLVAES